jgi:translation elongation factor P/translation initiation factor 5A
MAKEKEYKFTDKKDFTKILTDMSFKRAVKRIQNQIKDNKIWIDYITKKGKPISRWVALPIGRQKKIER